MTKEKFIIEKLSEDSVHRTARLNFTPDLVEETICGIKFKVSKILTSRNGYRNYYYKSEEDPPLVDNKRWIKIILYDDQYWIVNNELSDDQLEELYKGYLKRKKLYEILKVGTEAIAKELNLKWTPYLSAYEFYDTVNLQVASRPIKDILLENTYIHRIDKGIDIDLNENTDLETIKTNLLNLNSTVISSLQIEKARLLEKLEEINNYLK